MVGSLLSAETDDSRSLATPRSLLQRSRRPAEPERRTRRGVPWEGTDTTGGTGLHQRRESKGSGAGSGRKPTERVSKQGLALGYGDGLRVFAVLAPVPQAGSMPPVPVLGGPYPGSVGLATMGPVEGPADGQ